MNSLDQEQQPLSSSSPPPLRVHHRHRITYTRLSAFAQSNPRSSLALLVTSSFLLGYSFYFCTSHPERDLRMHHAFPSRCADPVSPSLARQTVIDRVFNGTSPWDAFPPPHAAPFLRKRWSKGWGSNNAVFEHLIRQARPATIIEIGTFLGASATHMAGLARELGLETQILCIDDFRGWPEYYDEGKSLKMVNGDSVLLYQFMQNVVQANASGNVLFLPFSTGTALSSLCEWGVYGDLVEVDAAHDFHSAWADINMAYKVLRPGGVLFGHDYAWEGVRYAVHLFARLNGFQVKLDGKHWILY